MCPHCDQLLSDKAIKEHRRIYYDNDQKEWVKVTSESQEQEARSSASSPLGITPPSSDSSVDLSHSLFEEQSFDVDCPGPTVSDSSRLNDEIIRTIVLCYSWHR